MPKLWRWSNKKRFDIMSKNTGEQARITISSRAFPIPELTLFPVLNFLLSCDIIQYAIAELWCVKMERKAAKQARVQDI